MTDYQQYLLIRSTLRLQEANATADRVIVQLDQMTRDFNRLSAQLSETFRATLRR
jgi:hypothetical protein